MHPHDIIEVKIGGYVVDYMLQLLHLTLPTFHGGPLIWEMPGLMLFYQQSPANNLKIFKP